MAFVFNGNNVNYKIEGDEKLVALFRALPQKLSKKVLVSTMRKGGQQVISEIKLNVPPEIKGVSASLGMSVTGRDEEMPGLLVGFFRRQRYFTNKTGKARKQDLAERPAKMDAATIAYWFNYGTYANRTGNFSFRTPRKKRSATRGGGINASLFLQKGIVSGFKKANETIVKDFENIIDKELQKAAR